MHFLTQLLRLPRRLAMSLLKLIVLLQRHKQPLAFALILLVAASFTLAQTTLGNMFKLAETTTAARPASSTTIRGALLYDTDVAAVIYNTGVVWSLVGNPLWQDLGGGLISPSTSGNGVSLSTGSGSNAVVLTTNGARVDLGTGSNDYLNSDGTDITTPGSVEFTGTAPASQVQMTGDGLFRILNSGITASTASLTTPAFLLQETAALDTGDTIFAVAHGGGATYDFYVPAGAAAQAVNGLTSQANGLITTPGAFPSSANTSTGQFFASGTSTLAEAVFYDGTNWRPLADNNWGTQKKALRAEVTPGLADCFVYQTALRNSAGANIGSTCRTRTAAGTLAADATATSTFSSDSARYYRMSTTVGNSPTTDIEKAYHFTGTTDTMEFFTQPRLAARHCAWVRTGPAVTSVRLWHGLASFDFNTSTGQDLPTTRHVAALRFSTSVPDTNWMLVTCNASSCTATSTGVAVTADTDYQLCIDLTASDAKAYVNKVNTAGTVTTTSSTLPTSSGFLGVYHYVQNLADSARSFGCSNYESATN